MLWIATVVSNVGTWMNDVGAGWLMTTLDPSPATVALVQAATTLPVFLFALPAGALADIIDRRLLLLVVVLSQTVVATALAVVVWADAMTVELLLLFTFLLGSGAAFLAPTWQAIVPGLVPREQLGAAVSLNSVGVNISRAIGPALGGALIVSVGLYAPFVANALSFLGVIAALWLWRGEAKKAGALPPEHVLPAMGTGLRYARRSPELQRTILRAVSFFLFAAAFWAMLPLIARNVLGGGAPLYGVLLGCVGAGAVGGAALLPALKARLNPDQLVLVGGLGTAVSMVGFALAPAPWAAAPAALLAGASWIACLSSFQVSAQASLPNWVRARGLSLFLTAFFGAMTGGSIVWGLVAEAIGVAPTLLVAAVALAVTAFLTQRIHLTKGGVDRSPSLHWPAPPPVPPLSGDAGPVMVSVDYRVDPAQRNGFDALMAQLRETRLRDGGYSWRILRPLEEPGVVREIFFLPSWLDHLRQHERVTESEATLQAAIRETLIGTEAPIVRHHVPADAELKEAT
ncbi:MAG: MFS transporter [Devosia sp.]